MVITRRMDYVNTHKDCFGNVDIQLTSEEMYNIYKMVKLEELKKDIVEYLFSEYDFCNFEEHGFNEHDIAEDIVSEISYKLENDSYLSEVKIEKLWEYLVKTMKTKYGIKRF